MQKNKHAPARGARIVERCPVEPKQGSTPDAFAWVGPASAFRRAGFAEVLQRSQTRPIMRRVVKRGWGSGGAAERPVTRRKRFPQ